MKIRRALLSVWDKRGIVELARELAALGVELISTGGTAAALQQAGLTVTTVSEVTGHPEILEGRVKSLHPRIHGGILARRDQPSHLEELAELGIGPMDLVAVNLYPFSQAVAKLNCTLEEALENIDIGGPAMLRGAAKNFPGVVPLCRPQDFGLVVQELKEAGEVSLELRRKLAATAFAHTSAYDNSVQAWLGQEQFPQSLQLSLSRGPELRYGENPHQGGAVYCWPQGGGLAWAEPLQGKQLSYNNYNDTSAALALAAEFEVSAAVVVKHAVPCGVALGTDLAEAFKKAWEADPVSIFGGIVALNREVDEATALLLREIFLEVVAAPAFSPAAREVLKGKQNLRLLPCPPVKEKGLSFRSISGGILVQEQDQGESAWQVVSQLQPSPQQLEEAQFAWQVAKHLPSNAIALCKDLTTVGLGGGFTSRIAACRAAIAGAGEKARGAVLASDGFIPFPDVVEAAAQAGVQVIVQPGGSKGDGDVVAAVDRLGLCMVFTGIRHFRH
jgi:phosphoribosylaminoimidazolecarboxamide formyltransferase/IMP cyclohydrolase